MYASASGAPTARRWLPHRWRKTRQRVWQRSWPIYLPVKRLVTSTGHRPHAEGACDASRISASRDVASRPLWPLFSGRDRFLEARAYGQALGGIAEVEGPGLGPPLELVGQLADGVPRGD
jgi:hypothetical protein